MAKRQMLIGGQVINVTDIELSQSELQFYPQNPRISTVLAELGDNPPQMEIEKIMKRQEHVKELRQSIELNGGLLEPVIVKNNIVLEGNSRLAAYRILASKDPIRWAKIRCSVLPDDTTEDTVFALLGTLHLVGKTPWSPYEQAGYLVRRLSTSRKSIDALAREVGMKVSEAKAFVTVFKTMLENQEDRPSQWSRFYELHKNRDINNADENRPQFRIKDRIIEMIKDDKIPDSRDVRKIAIIAKATGENAEEAMENVLNGDITIGEGVELVGNETKLAALTAKTEAFRDYLNNEVDSFNAYKEDAGLRRALNVVYSSISSIIND